MDQGIILAGGTGSRLSPLTQVVNKHLLGINGKFIIDYPLNTLKEMGIENVTVILGGAHFSQIVGYLQDGSRYGMNFNYVYQGEPKGIAHAISLCKKQVGDKSFAVILGDNVYENPIKWSQENNIDLSKKSITSFYMNSLLNLMQHKDKAQVVLHEHPELHRFGVASIKDNKIVKIEEKPNEIDTQLSNYAITGCYKFTPEYFSYFEQIKPSARNEYEITDIINLYNKNNKLSWTFSNGLWSDAGTHSSINYINNYFYTSGEK